MQGAGYPGIEFGIDSVSSQTLKKSFTQETIIQSSKLCEKLQLPHSHYLLFGVPREDRRDCGGNLSIN